MSTWVNAKETWIAGELVLATDMNLIGNDLNWLKAPPAANYVLNQGSDYTTTSTSFVSVDATNLALAITPVGTNVLIGFSGSLSNSTVAQSVYLDVDINGSRFGGDDGILILTELTASYGTPMSFVVLKTGLMSNTLYTFKLQWKVTANTGKLWAGAGTTGLDLHPQFWVREI